MVRDGGFSAVQQDELWHLWKEGASFGSIARSLNAEFQHVRRFLGRTGGLKVPPPRRSPSHLTTEEREEISRGIASGLSARTIAKHLCRPASTVSREIRCNGGREACRAHEAEAAALQRSRRPKQAKPARESELLFPHEPAMRISHEAIYLLLFDPRCRAINRKLSDSEPPGPCAARKRPAL